MNQHLQDVKSGRMMFIMCWIAYAAAYVGRISYYTSLAGMVGDCGFSKSEAGLIGTAFFFTYGCGQLINGILGDHFSPFKMILAGLTLSAAANLAIVFSHHYILMTVIWGINGLAQSMLWSPILFIFVHVIHPDLKAKACLYISTSTPVGTVITYLTSVVILKYSSWRFIYLQGAVVLFIAAALWLWVSLRAMRHLVEDEPDVVQNPASNRENRPPHNMLELLAMSGGSVMLLAIMIHGMLKEGVPVWVPTMIVETYHVSSSFSVFLSTFLPVVSLIGPYAIDYLYKRKLQNDEVKASAICLASAIPSLCILLLIGRLPVAASIAVLALISASMAAFNYIAITMIPVRFSVYHKASTATGLLNSVTYLGCAVSTYGSGLLSDWFGWNLTVVFWAGLAILGVAACCLARRRWLKFIQL